MIDENMAINSLPENKVQNEIENTLILNNQMQTDMTKRLII